MCYIGLKGAQTGTHLLLAIASLLRDVYCHGLEVTDLW